MYYIVLTIPLAQYELLLEKIDPSSRAYEILINGCFDQEMCGGRFERRMEVLCSKAEARVLLQLAEELCPRIVPSIARDWVEI